MVIKKNSQITLVCDLSPLQLFCKDPEEGLIIANLIPVATKALYVFENAEDMAEFTSQQ